MKRKSTTVPIKNPLPYKQKLKRITSAVRPNRPPLASRAARQGAHWRLGGWAQVMAEVRLSNRKHSARVKEWEEERAAAGPLVCGALDSVVDTVITEAVRTISSG